MSNLTLDSLNKALGELGKNRPAVGAVVKPEFEPEIRSYFHQWSNPLGLSDSFLGIPVYVDGRQEEDCLLFYDRDLLTAYLNRNSIK